MALSVSGLSSAIQTQLASTFPTGDEVGGQSGATWRTQFADAVATAIVNYFKTNADVVLTGTEFTVSTAVGAGVVNAGTAVGGLD